MRVVLSVRAQAELRAALDYHSDTGAADRFNLQVEGLLRRMERFPTAAQTRPEWTQHDVRFWLVAPFWFVTQQRSDLLLIATVVHASRDLRAYLRHTL